MNITEGKAEIIAEKQGKVSKKMGVFYNPAMKLNRDLTIMLLNSIDKKKMQIADPLAGTGIRSIRMLLELQKGKIENLSINDYSKDAIAAVKKNIRLNKIKIDSRIKISTKDANIFLLESTGFDYIDIDPFGYPGKFLDAVAQRIARNGILAVTATDTAALSGSSPDACIRKYWAQPLRNEFMHETGIRIMIRRVQLAGMQHEKALIPILSYADQHYMRAFFQCKKGKMEASEIYKNHGYVSCCGNCLKREKSLFPKELCSKCGKKVQIAGPLWLGSTSNPKLIAKIKAGEHDKLLSALKEEAEIESPWFYNINNLSSKLKIKSPMPIEKAIAALRQKGYKACRTHYDWAAIKTDAEIEEIEKAL